MTISCQVLAFTTMPSRAGGAGRALGPTGDLHVVKACARRALAQPVDESVGLPSEDVLRTQPGGVDQEVSMLLIKAFAHPKGQERFEKPTDQCHLTCPGS